MIRLSQVTLRRGAKTLLEGADVSLNPGDRIGLIGANGSGKSSLFALLRGELHADQGEVDYPARWRVAYVAQETPALERTALEYAIDGDTTLRKLEARLAAAEAADDGHLLGETRLELSKGGVAVDRVLDRKSTRLNSSHTVNSYAVFYFKKRDRLERRRRVPPGRQARTRRRRRWHHDQGRQPGRDQIRHGDYGRPGQHRHRTGALRNQHD